VSEEAWNDEGDWLQDVAEGEWLQDVVEGEWLESVE